MIQETLPQLFLDFQEYPLEMGVRRSGKSTYQEMLERNAGNLNRNTQRETQLKLFELYRNHLHEERARSVLQQAIQAEGHPLEKAKLQLRMVWFRIDLKEFVAARKLARQVLSDIVTTEYAMWLCVSSPTNCGAKPEPAKARLVLVPQLGCLPVFPGQHRLDEA